MSYQEISDTQLAAGAPVTQQLMQQLVDNPVASNLGHSSAPAQKLKEFTYPQSPTGSINDLHYMWRIIHAQDHSSYHNFLYVECQRAGTYTLYTKMNSTIGTPSGATVRWRRIRSGTNTIIKTLGHSGVETASDINPEDFLAGDIIYLEGKSNSNNTYLQAYIGAAMVARSGTSVDQKFTLYKNQHIPFSYASTTTTGVVRYGFSSIGI
jgi:hypothetical protein